MIVIIAPYPDEAGETCATTWVGRRVPRGEGGHFRYHPRPGRDDWHGQLGHAAAGAGGITGAGMSTDEARSDGDADAAPARTSAFRVPPLRQPNQVTQHGRPAVVLVALQNYRLRIVAKGRIAYARKALVPGAGLEPAYP